MHLSYTFIFMHQIYLMQHDMNILPSDSIHTSSVHKFYMFAC
jgi:hypothetical protein